MIRACLLAVLFAILSNLVWAQDPGSESEQTSQKIEEAWVKNWELSQDIKETSQLIVMIRDQLGGGPSFGAGIVFGRDHERLYIATANHVVRRGAQQAASITVSLLFEPEKSFPAILLDHFDASMDIGVIAVEGWTKLQIPGCLLPFHSSLSDPSPLDTETAVFAIGNPNGEAWRPPSKDELVRADRQEVRFRSAFLGPGYSGGGLLDDRGMLEGMIVRDEAPIGSAVPINAVMANVGAWGYPVELRDRDENPIGAAVRSGDMERLNAALSDVCARPETALFDAAKYGQPEMLSALLKKGADANTSEGKQTALHIAVESHHPQAVRLLLAAGAKVNVKDGRDNSPIDLVNPEDVSPKIAQEQLDIVRMLVDAGAGLRPDSTEDGAFGHALWAGNTDIAALLIRAGANVVGGNFRTPLEIAVEVGSEDLVKLLLAAGASAASKKLLHLAFLDNQETHSGTPRPRSEALLVMLLRAGAPISGQDYRDAPLLEAINLGWRDATRLLVERGANVNESKPFKDDDYDSLRPLELAIRRNDLEMVKLLLASGANPNAHYVLDGLRKEDPLQMAACHSGPPMLQLLLHAGAPINQRNAKAETALHEAIRCQNAGAEQFLLQHGGIK